MLHLTVRLGHLVPSTGNPPMRPFESLFRNSPLSLLGFSTLMAPRWLPTSNQGQSAHAGRRRRQPPPHQDESTPTRTWAAPTSTCPRPRRPARTCSYHGRCLPRMSRTPNHHLRSCAQPFPLPFPALGRGACQRWSLALAVTLLPVSAIRCPQTTPQLSASHQGRDHIAGI